MRTEYAGSDFSVMRAAQVTGRSICRAMAANSSTNRSGPQVASNVPWPHSARTEARSRISSMAAALDEIRLLASVLAECGHGTFEATWGPDLFVDEFAAIARQIDRPVTWAALMTLKSDPAYSVRITREIEEAGGSVFPQISCSPIVVQLSLADPAPLANVPAFGEILSLPHAERAARYAETEWRQRARVEVRERWGDKLDDATVQETELHRDLRHGPTLGQLARQAGTDSLDVMVDLALEEQLGTRFRIVMTNDDDDQIGVLLGNTRFLL